MDGIFFKPKVDSKADFLKETKQALQTDQDHFPILVQCGMQHNHTLSVSKPIKFFLHTSTSRAHNFTVHYGAGVNNKITLWTQNASEHRPRRLVKEKRLGYEIRKLIYMSSQFVYVAACTDLRLRVLGVHFDEYSSFQMTHTVLDMLYCEHLNAFMTSIAGFIQVFKLGFFLHDPPCLVKEIRLPLLNGEIAWVYQLSLDLKSNEILAVCHQGLLFVSCDTADDLCCKNVLENHLSSSMTSAVLYPLRHYVLTGHKDGSIKAWNTTMQRFPLFGSFLGHSREILQLAIHWSEPLLFSTSLRTIRIWNIETFEETYRFNAQEPVLSLKLIGPNTLLYSTVQQIKVWDLHLFYTLFTNVGARALRLSRVSAKDLPTRIMYIGGDGGVRLISPVHGSVLSMSFPIINHQLVDVLHDVRANAMYVLLADGNVMVFSTQTHPCSTLQLWVAPTYDDRICSIELLESVLLETERASSSPASLLFGGHVSGHISLLRGNDFHLEPYRAHQGRVIMLKTRKHNCYMKGEWFFAYLISYGSDNMVMIWNIKSNIDEISQKALELAMIMRIDMTDIPRDMLLVGNTFAMITEHSLYMNNIENTTPVTSYSQSEFIASCSIQEHFGNIIQMCACESLCIIATCGKDSHVRIWDTENNLVRELSFDEEVQGVCFGNDRGDLMIGLQSKLYFVPAWKYLTPFYLRMLLDIDIQDDENENCISFDQLLKFWYNDSWVRTVPIGNTNITKLWEPENRRGKKSIGLNENEYERLREILLLKSEEQEEDSNEKFLNQNSYEPPRQSRRATFVRISAHEISFGNKISNRNTMLPPLEQSDSAMETTEMEIQRDENDSKTNVFTSEIGNPKPKSCQDLFSTEKNAGAKNISKEKGASDSKEEESYEKDHRGDSEIRHQLSVNEACEKIYWPCAPDGFIPNSVVRNAIKPTVPPDYAELIRQLEENEANSRFKKLLFDIAMLPKLMMGGPEIEPQHVPKTEEKYEEMKMEFVWSSDESDGEGELDEISMNGMSRRETVEKDIFQDEKRQKSETENAPDITTENVRAEKVKKKSGKRPSSSVQKDAGKTELTSKETENKHAEKEKENNEKSYDFSKTLEIKEGPTPIKKPDLEESSKEEPDRQDEIPEIFKRRMAKSWFPKNVPMETSAIVKDLTGKLETADALETKDIAALLLQIQSHLGMTTPVLDSLIETLKRLSRGETTAKKHVAVKTMIELGKNRDDVIVQLVELLSDPAKIIRYEARYGLQSLAGIEDFEGLRSAMENMNLLKDESEQPILNDIEIMENLKTKLIRAMDNGECGDVHKNLLMNWLRNSKKNKAGQRDDSDFNDEIRTSYEDLNDSYSENEKESRSDKMERRNDKMERTNDKMENRNDKMENRNDKMENRNDKMENRNDEMENRKDETKHIYHGMESRTGKMEYGRNDTKNGNDTTGVFEQPQGNHIPIMITENIAASIAPKLFRKFQQYQVASGNEPSKEELEVDSVGLTSYTAFNRDDFLNNPYSGIVSTNADKNSNKRTASRNELSKEEPEVHSVDLTRCTALNVDGIGSTNADKNGNKRTASRNELSKQELEEDSVNLMSYTALNIDDYLNNPYSGIGSTNADENSNKRTASRNELTKEGLKIDSIDVTSRTALNIDDFLSNPYSGIGSTNADENSNKRTASRNERSKEGLEIDSIDLTSFTALNIHDFLNNPYSGIGSTNADKNGNKRTASRNERSKEELEVESVDLMSFTAFLNNPYPGIGSTNADENRNKRTVIKDGDNKERKTNGKTHNNKKSERIKHVEKLSNEMKQRNHIFSSLMEVSMNALMLERTASKDDCKVLNEQTLKGLTALIEVVKRDDIDIPLVAGQAMLFINDLKKQLQTARMASMQLASKELPHQLANDIVCDYTKVHHQQRLIHSPIRRSMVTGIRGERIAKSIEITQHYNDNNKETIERRIFGIPERLGCYAAEDSGACKFGKMTMSWTTKAPSYDMDLSQLNEQRIRPLKLQKRHVFNDQASLARKNMQRVILPSLVKKRLGVNMDILSRKSKRLRLLASTKASKTGVVKLPLLGQSTDVRPHRSHSSMFFNSNFYEHVNSKGSAIDPPPPPNTAELL